LWSFGKKYGMLYREKSGNPAVTGKEIVERRFVTNQIGLGICMTRTMPMQTALISCCRFISWGQCYDFKSICAEKFGEEWAILTQITAIWAEKNRS
jgi:hypothetical protein